MTDPSTKCEILGQFHPSTLRHFERAHMISCELDPTQVRHDNEDTSRQERCERWVLNEIDHFPRDLASWEGSIKYDSGSSTRVDSYSGVHYPPPSNHQLACRAVKSAKNLESWTSTSSSAFTPAFVRQQQRQSALRDPDGIETPRSSCGTEHDSGEKSGDIEPGLGTFKSK